MKRFLMWTAPLALAAMPAMAQQSTGDSKMGGTATAGPGSPTATGAPVAPTVVASTPSATPSAKPRKICRADDVTGSRIAKTTCRTKEQWAAIDQANQDAASKFVNGQSANSSVMRNGGGGGFGGSGAAASVIGLGPN